MTTTAVDPIQALRSRLANARAAACLDDSTLARALYSTDASLYRVVPQAVAKPRTVDELLVVLDAARSLGIPVTGRGAGTSCAGNAVSTGLVVDLAAHLNTIVSLDPDARTAVVEPGVIQDDLQRAARPFGLRFGPDPSTSTRCTIGGMVGNNACGPRALGYGTTAQNLLDAEVVAGTGELLTLSTARDTRIGRAVSDLVGRNLGTIRTEFGTFSRQVSGYSLEHLLPEKGGDVVRFFAGTEGTLGIASRLTVRLVADAPVAVMVALGYPSMADAADAMPVILPFRPTACEGMDRRIVEVVKRARGASSVPPLPRGDGWLFVELRGDVQGEVLADAEALTAASGALEGWVVAEVATATALWKIRADGAGLAGVSLDSPAYPGWEDAAVPPARLGAYLRDFEGLLDEYGLQGLPYGHFGDGCVHCRIDFPLTSAGGTTRYADFVTDAARLVARYGGSMSGEHGDGRARSALLPAMYSPAAINLFGQVKQIFDPENLMNPGVLVDPRPVDADVRYAGLVDNPLIALHPKFTADVHRCTGVGACVAAHSAGVMCPSYQATRDEKDSTRGRARVLQELVNGSLVTGSWKAPEVHAALDLCLSCKGCRRDCPTGTDMAAYKSYVLNEAYKGKRRPRTHYTLGWLPTWGRLVTRVPGLAALANATLATPGLRGLAKLAAGVDQRRPLPGFRRTAARKLPAERGSGPRPVVVWVDSFTDSFEGTSVAALVRVLIDAGYAPRVLDEPVCCGLTWITTGQLDRGAEHLRAALDVLHPIVAAGVPVVGMDPSCMAVWRSDAPELVSDPRVEEVATGVFTLAEFLGADESWTPPSLAGHTIVAQPHCHHASVLGWAADAKLLERTGATVVTLGGCCGLAGNFGVERGHYETSVAVAENELLPAIRAAGPDAILLADGFSCRKQISDLTERDGMTLAELLATHAPGGKTVS